MQVCLPAMSEYQDPEVSSTWSEQHSLHDSYPSMSPAHPPDLPHNGALSVMVGQPVEDALVQHELPDGPMPTRLQQRSQALRQQPLPVLSADDRHQGLLEDPAQQAARQNRTTD